MNVQLHHVITDIIGVTGQAIVAGERDAATLAQLRDRPLKAENRGGFNRSTQRSR